MALQQGAKQLGEVAAARAVQRSVYGAPQAPAPSNAVISSILASTAREQMQKQPAKAF
jgi:hypothetical protein